eukprot:1088467-Pyramimonas_sp.AAC.1
MSSLATNLLPTTLSFSHSRSCRSLAAVVALLSLLHSFCVRRCWTSRLAAFSMPPVTAYFAVVPNRLGIRAMPPILLECV